MWRWLDPLEELKKMQERIDRLLGEMEKPRRLLPGEVIDFPVDVMDEDDKIRVVAELPGFEKKDIEVSVEDRYLLIKCERKEEK
jgi:HSP20 family protein